jgi:hypothetical protein
MGLFDVTYCRDCLYEHARGQDPTESALPVRNGEIPQNLIGGPLRRRYNNGLIFTFPILRKSFGTTEYLHFRQPF